MWVQLDFCMAGIWRGWETLDEGVKFQEVAEFSSPDFQDFSKWHFEVESPSMWTHSLGSDVP
jgi:hypothetical protein